MGRRQQRAGRVIVAILVGLLVGVAAVLGDRLFHPVPPGAGGGAADRGTRHEDDANAAGASGTGGREAEPPATTPGSSPNPGWGLGSIDLAPDVPTTSDAIDELRRRSLLLPVDKVTPADLQPSFTQARSQGEHEALDILAPRGTPVRAVEDGSIAKLFESERGGLTVYQFDPTRRYAYYYAHLDRYAHDLREGQAVRRGSIVGYVGTTGNAPPDTPHLHFAIFVLTPEKRWWQGTAVDPFLVWREPAE